MRTLEAEHLLLLLRCTLSDRKFPTQTENIDLSTVYALACRQGVEHVIYEALQVDAACASELKVGMQDRYMRWLRTLATRDYYKEQIFRAFEKANIRYIPLKGAIFSAYYPVSSMRTSSDLDLLYDGKQVDLESLKQVMLTAGASKWEYGKEHSLFWFDTFLVELHPALFATNDTFHPYFSTIWERASVEQDGNYRMCPEDVYLYHIAHMVKHMLDGGIGIRSLVDLFLFLHSEKIDQAYVDKSLAELGLLRFAQNMENLAEACFTEHGVLTEVQKEWLAYFLSGDMYGTTDAKTALQGRGALTEEGRVTIGYYFRRIFPSYFDMKWLFPVLKKAPILLPFFYVWRLVRTLLFGRKKAREELQKIKSVDIEKRNELLAFYREIGIEEIVISKQKTSNNRA